MLTLRERVRPWLPDGSFFLIVLVLLITWLVAIPRWASPDEPAHVYKAYGTAHGQLLGDAIPATPPNAPLPSNYRRFDGPLALGIGNLRCYVGNPDKPAGCEGTPAPDLISTASRYPPYYYAVVGGAAAAVGQADNVRAYRFASALICAVAITAAFALLRRSKAARLSPLMLVALTPMALFLLGSVNPSAFEIAGFVLIWALLVRVSTDDDLSKRFTLALAVVAGFLVLVRPISAAWLVVVAVVGVIVTSPARLRALMRWPYLLRLAVPLVISAVASFAWLRYANFEVGDATVATNLTLRQVVRQSIDQMPLYYRETIGVLGWLDTRLPPVTYVGWTIALLLVAAIYLMRSGWRNWLAVIAIVGAWVGSPIVINAATAADAGLSFQGRYSLPIVAGAAFLPMLGPRKEPLPRVTDSFVYVALGLISIAEVAAFWQMIRRFSVGEHGKIWLTGSMPWTPPITPMLLIAINAVAMVALCAGAVSISRRSVAVEAVVDDRAAAGVVSLQTA